MSIQARPHLSPTLSHIIQSHLSNAPYYLIPPWQIFASEEGEGDFYFDETEVIGGLDEEARAALLARQAAGMDLEEAEEELGEVRKRIL